MGAKKSKTVDATILTDKQLRYLENKTGLSAKEINEWHKDFLNHKPDGLITQQDFERVFREFYPQGDPTKYSRLAFRKFDPNQNGRITFDEFLLTTSFVLVNNQGQDVQRALDLAFDIFDVDNNGRIDRNEMREVTVALYELEGESARLAEQKIDSTFKTLDADRNNYLNKHEFIKFITTDEITSRLFF